MEQGLNFNPEEINTFATKYPEAWYFLNTLRLQRELLEAKRQLHALGPIAKSAYEPEPPSPLQP